MTVRSISLSENPKEQIAIKDSFNYMQITCCQIFIFDYVFYEMKISAIVILSVQKKTSVLI